MGHPSFVTEQAVKKLRLGAPVPGEAPAR